MDFQEKKKIRRLIYSRAMAGILVVFLWLAISAAWGVYKKYKETKDDRNFVEEKYEELVLREQGVLEEIERLDTQKGVEGEIRKKFGLVKEGEGVIILVEPKEGEGGERTDNQDTFLSAVWKSIVNLFR